MWTRVLRLLRDPIIAATMVATLAFVVNLGSLGGDFVYDDVPAIADNPLVDGRAPVSAIFEQSFWGARPGYEHVTTWRPLTTLGFRLTWLISDSPAAFRLVNLVLHALVAALVVVFVGLSSRRTAAGLLAGALFAVMPVHVEAVAGSVNRGELQAAALYLFGLIALLKAQRARSHAAWAGALVAYALALLSKEHAITFPVAGALLYVEALVAHRRAPTRHARPSSPPVWALVATLGVTAAYVWARRVVLPAAFVGDIPVTDNPIVGLAGIDAFMTACKVYLTALRLLVAPVRLGADYGPNVITPADGLHDPVAVIGLLAAVASVTAAGWAFRRHLGLFGVLMLFAVLYAPISSFIVPSSAIMGERLLYLPSVAVAAGFGRVADGALSRARLIGFGAVVTAALVMLLAAYAGRSVLHVRAYRDDLTLFQASILAYPDSGRAHQNLAVALMVRGRVDEAESLAYVADGLLGGDPDAQLTIGEVAWRHGRADAAMSHAYASMAKRPSRAAMKLLCRADTDLGRWHDAAEHCGIAAEYAKDEAEWWHRRGVSLMRLGRTLEAAQVLDHAAKLEPNHPGIRLAQDELGRLTARPGGDDGPDPRP